MTLKRRYQHVRQILAAGLEGYGYRLDSAQLDALTAKYCAFSASTFGTDRLDNEALQFTANYLADKLDAGIRLDAGESLIVAAAGMLESKLPDQKVVRPPVKARLLMKVTHLVERGAKIWSYNVFDHTGMAQLVENYSDDIESVALFASKVTGDVLTYAKSYDWTWEDMNAAAMTQTSLQNELADAVAESFERRVDHVGALGQTGTDVTGLLNNPNIPDADAAPAAAGGNAPEWDGADKTPEEVLQDLLTTFNGVITTSKDVHKADRIVGPLSHKQLVEQLILEDVENTPTVWEHFKKLTGFTGTFETWHFTETADPSGGEMLVMFDSRYAPELEIPVEPEDLPPQPKALAVVVNTLAKLAGVRVRWPLAAAYLYNI
jgi:hypothetical protein